MRNYMYIDHREGYYEQAHPMDSDQLPCLDMDTDLYKAVMTGDMGYLHINTRGLQSIPCKTTAQRQNVLHIAADFKSIDLGRNLAALFPVLLTRADLRGNTPLHNASERGCSDLVACFLQREVAEQALEMKNDMGDTALHVAVRNGHLGVVKLLVQKNSKLLDLVNKNKESPLYMAVVRGFFEIAEFMLEGYSSVCSYEGTKGMTALHAAVIHTHKGPHVPESGLSREKFQMPREFFFSGSFRGKRFQDEIDIMKLLLEKKKDAIRQTDEFGWSPLHYAAHLGHHEATKKLLAVDGYLASLCDVEQSCALHIAAKNGHSDVIKEILACRPDVYNLVDYKSRTILHIAAQFGKTGVIKYILKQPNLESLINKPDKAGNTALHLAAIHLHYGLVITLAADNRVDKRAMNNDYLKAIHILDSDVGDGSITKLWAMLKLNHTGGGQGFHHFVAREQRDLQNGDENEAKEVTASNTSSTHESSDGVSHTESNMRNREVMEAKELVSHRLKGVSKTNLLVAALIATVAFQAGLSPPGGFLDEGPNKGTEAVFSSDLVFKFFLLINGSAFYSSTAALFIHFYASIREHNHRLRLLLVQMAAMLIFVSILQMMIAFSFNFYFALPNNVPLSVFTISVTILTCVCEMGLFYIVCNPKKVWKLV